MVANIVVSLITVAIQKEASRLTQAMPHDLRQRIRSSFACPLDSLCFSSGQGCARMNRQRPVSRGSAKLLYLFENHVLDINRRELHRGTIPVVIEPQAFDLLAYLIQNRERVVSKDDLIATIWNGRIISESALSTSINAARSAIDNSGDQQRLIRTFLAKAFVSWALCLKSDLLAGEPQMSLQRSNQTRRPLSRTSHQSPSFRSPI